MLQLEHLQHCSVCDPAKTFHIQVLVIYFFATAPIELKLGLQVCGRLLIATHLDQPNYLPDQR
jgi:hypothetical protein